MLAAEEGDELDEAAAGRPPEGRHPEEHFSGSLMFILDLPHLIGLYNSIC